MGAYVAGAVVHRVAVAARAVVAALTTAAPSVQIPHYYQRNFFWVVFKCMLLNNARTFGFLIKNFCSGIIANWLFSSKNNYNDIKCI